MIAFDCDRLSWGPFERPVRMLFESHNSFLTPDACFSKSDVTIQHEIINTLWVNDTEVAAYLRDTYGFPVHVSSIDIQISDPPGPGGKYVVTWGPENEPSWFRITDDIGQTEGARTNLRYFWYNGTTLGALDFFWFRSNDDTGDNPATGEMHAPMLMAQLNENYVSIGMWQETARVDGDSIELYKDPQCEESV